MSFTNSVALSVAYLVSDIGGFIGTEYGSLYDNVGSGAGTSNAVYCFEEFGYSSSGKYMQYDFNVLANFLNNFCPVIVDGDRTDIQVGHAWVIDGYKIYQKDQTYTLKLGDGYFLSEVFDIEKRVSINAPSHSDYSQDPHMVVNIKK